MIKSLVLAVILCLAQAEDGVIEIPAFETESLIRLLDANGHRTFAAALREQANENDPMARTHYWDLSCYLLVHRLLNLNPR